MSFRLAVSFLLLISLSYLSAAQAVPQRVRVSAAVGNGLLQSRVNPTYPPLARQARIQGTVVLKVTISKSGDVGDVQLVSGHPMLAPAAIEAVKQWKFRPYLLNGNPVEVETSVQVNFVLADKPQGDNVIADQPGSAPGTGPNEVPGGIPGSVGVVGGIVGSILPATPGDNTHPPLPRRVRVSSGVASSLLIKRVPPAYPAEARDQHIEGAVVLKVDSDREGNVYNVELISGHPLLAPAAIDAVKQWKYKPYLLNNEPIDLETSVQVNFTLAP
jgi:TonB family protein